MIIDLTRRADRDQVAIHIDPRDDVTIDVCLRISALGEAHDRLGLSTGRVQALPLGETAVEAHCEFARLVVADGSCCGNDGRHAGVMQDLHLHPGCATI